MSTKSTGTRTNRKENVDRKPRSEAGGRRQAVARVGSATSVASALRLSTETPKESVTSLHRAEPVQCLATPAESMLDIEMDTGMELAESKTASPASGTRPVIIEMASDCSDVELPTSGTGIVTGFSARGHLSSQAKDALNTMERRQRTTRSTRSELLIKKALTQSTAAAAASELQPGARLEIVSRSPAGSLASVTDDEDWSDLDGGVSMASGRTSILPSSKTGPTLTMEHAGKRANQLLQSGKEALETAGNMKRECRVAAADSLQQLYEMVLAISDSRSRHIVNLEQERKRSAKEVVRLERLHNKQISDIQKDHSIKIREILEKQEATHRVSESVLGWLNYELTDPIKTINGIQDQLTQIQDRLNDASSAPPADSNGTANKFKDISDKLTTLRQDVQEVQLSIRSVQRQMLEKPLPEATATATATSGVAVAEGVASGYVEASTMALILDEIKSLRGEIAACSRGGIDMEQTAGAVRSELKPVRSQLKEIQLSMGNIQEAREAELATAQMSGQAGVGAEMVLSDISGKMEMLERTMKNTEDIKTEIMNLKDQIKTKTYASVTASPPTIKTPEHTALHSIVITTKEGTQTGDEILDRVRKVVNAKEGDVQIERIRKAKDRKVIIGCKTEEGRHRLKEKLKEAGELNVENIKNKDPLIVMKDVLKHNTEEEIIAALRNQNKAIFQGLEDSENRITVAYQKPARNPHTSSIVVRVSPILWQRLVRVEAVHIDLQRIRVADQSPLVQCSLCLGYGHGRRFCTGKKEEKCSHCGGPHMKAQCEAWQSGKSPSCCNCTQAKLENTEHNAFSSECPVRRKWDALARTATAYC